MVITLRNEDRAKKDQIIKQKNLEGYTLINISEAFDSITSGEGGTHTIPSIVLEFKKI